MGIKSLSPPPANLVTNSFQRVPFYLYLSRSVDADPLPVLERLMAAYDGLVRAGVLGPADSRPEDIIVHN
jgi:hypothetical protein